MPFIGRIQEHKLLQKTFGNQKAEFVVMYGRRRIGKSALLYEFGSKNNALFFDGLEKASMQEQINHFVNRLKEQVKDPLLENIPLTTWEGVFSYLAAWMQKQKKKPLLIFDEFQWMANQKSSLVSLLKSYWDEHWKVFRPMLILCGSIASFMMNKVIKSKALYGRLTLELNIKEMAPNEAVQMLKNKRGIFETTQYLCAFGGVPKYLEEIDTTQSFANNISRLCFSKQGLMVDEFSRIFYGQFKEAEIYLKIVKALSQNNLGLAEIAHTIKMPSGGGLKRYLNNLELADFIRSYVPIYKGTASKLKKYKVFDSYLNFYFDFILPNLKLIPQGLASFEKSAEPKWPAWMGFAFERFCHKNIFKIAEIIGCTEQLIDFGPYYEAGNNRFQIDLLFQRKDQIINLFEIKYNQRPLTTEIIPEVKRKIALFPMKKQYVLDPILICSGGATKSLLDSEFFSQIITLEEFY